jgi:hypothetical protein
MCLVDDEQLNALAQTVPKRLMADDPATIWELL